MNSLCENATLTAGNESDFQDIFQMQSPTIKDDQLFDEIATQIFERFSKVKYIAISNRYAFSADSNTWSGYLFIRKDSKFKYLGVKYNLQNIVDRVGTGDSFVAGIIYGLLNNKEHKYQDIVDFATTLAALNHTIVGDASRFTAEEVWEVIGRKGSGRIIR